jgi:hypothetical protein
MSDCLLMLVLYILPMLTCFVIVWRMIYTEGNLLFAPNPWGDVWLAVGIAGLSVFPMINIIIAAIALYYRFLHFRLFGDLEFRATHRKVFGEEPRVLR